MERELAARQLLLARGQEGEELDLLGYLALVREELELLQFDYSWELDDDLLGELAKLGRLPATRVGGGVEELGHGVLGFFTTTVNYSVL